MTQFNRDRENHVQAVGGRRLINTREYKRRMGDPSEMKLWRDEQRGIGAKPVRQNGRRYWFEDEVDAYLERLAADRGKASGTASDNAAEDEESGLSKDEKSWLAKRLVDP